MFEIFDDKRLMTVWWGLAWRNLLLILGLFPVGFVSGFVVGVILGFFHVPMPIIQVAGFCVGAALGLLASLYFLRWILGRDLGGVSLQIVPFKARRPAKPRSKKPAR